MSYVDVTEETFEHEVVESSRRQPVVVDFWAAWCQPCRIIGPVLERLAAEPDAGFKLAKVDVDANPNLAYAFRIQSIPAVKAFADGQVVDEFIGTLPEQSIRQWLKGIVPDPSGDVEEARRLAAKGDYEGARSVLEGRGEDLEAQRLLGAIERVEREVPELAEGVPEAGLERLLRAAPNDPSAREAMVAAFEVLGDEDPATKEYRRRLASALF